MDKRKLQDGNQDNSDSDRQNSKKAKADSVQRSLNSTKFGGTYIPPARLRQMQAEVTDKSSEEFQKLAWDSLKKSINGLINRVNTSNIKDIVIKLLKVNLVRGRGVFVRSLMKSQNASQMFTPVYCALVSIINTKLPALGSLLITRLISSFQRSYRRNDKSTCLAITKFLAHLVNFGIAHEIVSLQILALLLERPTDDSVEVAVGFIREVGAYLTEASPKATHAIFERFRAILHEAEIDKRVQYMIEVLFQVRKDKFKDNPVIPEGLDLVDEDDQITHYVCLDDELNIEEILDVYKYDPNYEENEEKYRQIKSEILGDSDEEEAEESNDESDSEEAAIANGGAGGEIVDNTETNLVNLRKAIYLTIMSSLNFEEACHKLLKMTLKPGQEMHLCSMIVECCAQERMYEKYYGSIGEKFCNMNRTWTLCFGEEFEKIYSTVHRFETNRIRNMAKFFSHLLHTDALPWTVLQVVKLTEDDTTSASRIFIKILFQDISLALGTPQLQKRLRDDRLREYFSGIFPTDNARDIRFSINYFTSIGLGAITQDMRSILQNMPKAIEEPESDESESEYESSERSRSPSPVRQRSSRRNSRSRSDSRERFRQSYHRRQ